jgi:hypothetical protein
MIVMQEVIAKPGELQSMYSQKEAKQATDDEGCMDR